MPSYNPQLNNLPVTSPVAVTCAIIYRNNSEFLIVKRSQTMKHPLKWEFPGGKLEQDEEIESCLRRELNEELGLQIVIQKGVEPVLYVYSTGSICLHGFFCIALNAITLHEHSEFAWVRWDDLPSYDLLAADLMIIKKINPIEYGIGTI